MPLPTSSDLHVNALLTNVSVMLQQDPMNFVSDTFPAVPVAKQSDKYAEYDESYFFRTEMQKRAQGQDAVDAGYAVKTSSEYFCDVWGVRKPIDDQERANADSVFDLDQDATKFLTLQYMIRKEKEWVDAFFKTGVWSADVTPSTLWSAGGSTPFKDIRKEATTIKSKTGYYPTDLILGSKVWESLADHADMLDRIKGGATSGDPAVAMLQQFSTILGLKRVRVAGAVENTAKEGATASYDFIHGKHALLCYVPDSPGKYTPSAGYTFVWNGLVGSKEGSRILTYRKEPHIDYVEIEAAYDMKLITKALGTFFSAAVA